MKTLWIRRRSRWSRLHVATLALIGATGSGWLVVAAPSPAGAGAPPDQRVPFSADSGDSCRRGITQGQLVFPGWAPTTGAVDVAGFVADDAGFSPCSPDDRYSVATFTAYSRDLVVDTEAQKADNGRTEFKFQLTPGLKQAPIDVVTVQVCRRSWRPSSDYCGPVQSFKRP